METLSAAQRLFDLGPLIVESIGQSKAFISSTVKEHVGAGLCRSVAHAFSNRRGGVQHSS